MLVVLPSFHASKVGLILLAFLPFAIRPAMAQSVSSNEVHTQVDQFWHRRVENCNGVSYLHYAAGDWKAVQNLRWNVNERQLSTQDRVNGIQWAGATVLIGDSSRGWYPKTGSWQDWERGLGFGEFGVQVTKRGGRWTFTPSEYSAISKMMPVQCSEVPPEPIIPKEDQVATARTAAAPQLCQQFVSGSVIPSGRIPQLIEAGLDVRTCMVPISVNFNTFERRATVLMLIADRCIDEFVMLVLEAGADVNALDSRGWTALDWANNAQTAKNTPCKPTINILRANGARPGAGQR